LIGGLILAVLGTFLGGLGVWRLANPQGPRNDLDEFGAQLDLVLAAILIGLALIAVRGGRLGRVAVGLVCLGSGALGLLAVPTLNLLGLAGTPFLVTAYFLLRAPRTGHEGKRALRNRSRTR
jgi:hypothetical protein